VAKVIGVQKSYKRGEFFRATNWQAVAEVLRRTDKGLATAIEQAIEGRVQTDAHGTGSTSRSRPRVKKLAVGKRATPKASKKKKQKTAKNARKAKKAKKAKKKTTRGAHKWAKKRTAHDVES
jgi:hypothetical protein